VVENIEKTKLPNWTQTILGPGQTMTECLATKHHQTLFGDQTFYRLDTLFGAA